MLVRYIELGKAWHGASELVGAYQIQKEIKLKKFMGACHNWCRYFLWGTLLPYRQNDLINVK